MLTPARFAHVDSDRRGWGGECQFSHSMLKHILRPLIQKDRKVDEVMYQLGVLGTQLQLKSLGDHLWA